MPPQLFLALSMIKFLDDHYYRLMFQSCRGLVDPLCNYLIAQVLLDGQRVDVYHQSGCVLSKKTQKLSI